jgi:hypothetical protein
MDPQFARTMWHRIEPINAVTYFASECRQVPTEFGLKGFWMGYFASRAAPIGPVGPAVVEATFFNFHPMRIRRAIPDAWTYATPAQLLEARRRAAAAALRRLLGAEADRLAGVAVPVLRRIADAASPAGRPLFAANRDVPPSSDPVGELWQACTTLREHRGDGHVALVTSAGLDGCEVHVLFAATEGIDPALLQESRGWSAADWSAAVDRLAGRGLVAAAGAPTVDGRKLRAEIERRTDELAASPLEIVGQGVIDMVLDVLAPVAVQISGSGEIPFPNPMGLPPESG